MSGKRRSKSLKQQAHEILSSKTAYGDSRKKDKATGADKDKIYSIATYNNYLNQILMFVYWLKQTHPDVTKLKQAEKYYYEYLTYLEFDKVKSDGSRYSPYSVNLAVSALGKLYGIYNPDPRLYMVSTKRKRENITRSRIPTKSDKHFSETNNSEIIKFGKSTGLRKNKELAVIKGEDGMTREILESYVGKGFPQKRENCIAVLASTVLKRFPDVGYFIYVVGKGGKPRLVPILPENEKVVREKFESTPSESKVYEHVPAAMDEHSYRAEYAKTLYKHYARKIKDIPYDRINKGSGKRYQSEVYACRSDERGKKLDRKAMELASIALGHNRVSVIADHYLYGL